LESFAFLRIYFLRTAYLSIEVSFTIEPRSIYQTQALPDGSIEDPKAVRAPSSSIKAKMTSFGYLLPDPVNPIRFTIWFTGGVIAPVQKEKISNAVEKSGPTKQTAVSSKRDKYRTAAPVGKKKKGPSPGAISEDGALADLPSCNMTLQECRRRKKVCVVHNIDRPTVENKSRYLKMKDRYMRPAHGLHSRAGQTNSLLIGPSTLSQPFSAEWEDLFAPEENWKRSFSDQAKALAVKLLLGATLPEGMEDDGTMEFSLSRPIGGHGSSYVDVLYMDDNLRIIKGNLGSIFVQAREGMEKQAMSSKMLETQSVNLPSFKHESSEAKIDDEDEDKELPRSRDNDDNSVGANSISSLSQRLRSNSVSRAVEGAATGVMNRMADAFRRTSSKRSICSVSTNSSNKSRASLHSNNNALCRDNGPPRIISVENLGALETKLPHVGTE